MKITAGVLLSGGIDSTVCFHIAMNAGHRIIGLGVNYGQRHWRELEMAEYLCKKHKATFHVLDLSAVMPKTMLTDNKTSIPALSYNEIDGVSPTYAPFRNGLMLSAAAAHMDGRYNVYADRPHEWLLYFGAHAEDAHNWAYPDCTPEFVGAMANAIYIGTYHTLRLCVPLQWVVKWQIVNLGVELGVDFAKTWSCYAGGERHCGVCPTCRARREAFRLAGVHDPTDYTDAPAQSELELHDTGD